MLDNFGPHSFPAFDQNSNLAVWLHSSGYRTALVGKYLNDYTLYGHNEIPPGWDDLQAMDSVPMEEYYNYAVNENGRLEHYGTAPTDYSTTVLTNKAVDFLRKTKAGHPFFLYFAPIAPHLPAIPAKQDQNKLVDLAPLHSPSFNEAEHRRQALARLARRPAERGRAALSGRRAQAPARVALALDRSVKEIVDTLEAAPRARPHRDHVLERQRLSLGRAPARRQALAVRGVDARAARRAHPVGNGNGDRQREPVLNIDVAPTISALAGIDPPKREDGRSFVPFLHERAIPSWRKAYIIEYLGRNQLKVGGPPPYYAVHTRRYLYVEYLNGWRELYDLRKDPWELDNVAQSPRYAQIKASLHTELVQLESSPGETS